MDILGKQLLADFMSNRLTHQVSINNLEREKSLLPPFHLYVKNNISDEDCLNDLSSMFLEFATDIISKYLVLCVKEG